MKETLVKYLAGLMDADGSLSFKFKRDGHVEDAFHLTLSLNLASSDAIDRNGFIDRLPEHTGMGGVYRYGKNGGGKKYKTWTVNKRSEVEMLLPRLIKHMVVKGKHWQWMLAQWREHRGAWIPGETKEELSAASKRSRIENAGPVKPKNHPSWAWFAGFMDGDGWYRFALLKPPRTSLIQVGACAHVNDAHVLGFLHSAFGGVVFDHGQSPNVRVWRRNIGVSEASFALRFLPNLAKHSRLKRQKIDQIISYHRQRLSEPRVDRRNYCQIDNCGRPAAGHKMCNMHYVRWYRHGDPRHGDPGYVSDSLTAP